MNKKVYLVRHEDDNDEVVAYDLLLVPKNIDDILNPDNLIVSYPVSRSSAGMEMVSSAIFYKMAELQNQGYTVECFF